MTFAILGRIMVDSLNGGYVQDGYNLDICWGATGPSVFRRIAPIFEQWGNGGLQHIGFEPGLRSRFRRRHHCPGAVRNSLPCLASAFAMRITDSSHWKPPAELQSMRGSPRPWAGFGPQPSDGIA